MHGKGFSGASDESRCGSAAAHGKQRRHSAAGGLRCCREKQRRQSLGAKQQAPRNRRRALGFAIAPQSA